MGKLSREVQLRRADLVLETFRRIRCREELSEAVTPFYIWRTDTNQVLARGVLGYENAKDKTNQLRKQFGLKWDQVKFKSESKSKSSGSVNRGRVVTARNYNPSKRTRFKGVYDSKGNFADLD